MARQARKEPTIRELDDRLTKVERRVDIDTSGLHPDVRQEFVATREVVERVDRKLDAVAERLNSKIDATSERLGRRIDEERHSNDAMFQVLFRQLEADRLLADQRHAAIMSQFEKLLTRPSEN
jgi:hypothetical protein